MKILFLGYPDCRLINCLREHAEVLQTMNPIKNIVLSRFDLTISFGYRYILTKEALKLAPRPPLNLHISFLPWNRGADPNFWSFYNDTPKGVTIHEMIEEVDAGPIVFQCLVEFNENTLESTYYRLFDEIQNLFIENWDCIEKQNYQTIPQSNMGTIHFVGDMPALPDGWKTNTVMFHN